MTENAQESSVVTWSPTPVELAAMLHGRSVTIVLHAPAELTVMVSTEGLPHGERPLPDKSHPRCLRCHIGQIDELDDGSWVALENVSGGAHPSGYYGELSLSFHNNRSLPTVRHYVARDVLDQGKIPNG